ncbi:MAG: hypothetical protein HKM95_01120 [Inquilinus sp.]|nr:hypothetical protein [Inquilinus sp.]
MAGWKRRQLADEEVRRRPVVLGALAERGVGVFCWCNRCHHNAIVTSTQLIDQLGPDFPIPEVGAQMRCSGCGSKDVATRPDWPSQGQITRHD